MRQTTLKDVAIRLGLSPSTVSRGLAGDPKINVATRRKIVATAEEMGYQRNTLAATLRSGRSHTIGVIMSEITSPFTSVALEAIQQYMHERGIMVMIGSSAYDGEREGREMEMMRNSMVDGIMVGFCHTDMNIEKYRKMVDDKFPLVFFGYRLSGLDVSSVVTDSYERTYFMTEHLVRNGRKRIAFLRGQTCVEDLMDQFRGYQDAIRKFGLEEIVLTESEVWSFYEGRHIADEITGDLESVDAVVVSNDLMAAGVLSRLRQLGVTVPGEIAVSSLCGTPLANILMPSVTAIETSIPEMSHAACQLLLDLIEHPEVAPIKIRVESVIKVRESTVGREGEKPFGAGSCQ